MSATGNLKEEIVMDQKTSLVTTFVKKYCKIPTIKRSSLINGIFTVI